MPAKDIKWSGGGDLVAIIGESSFYVLRYEREAVEAAVESGAEMDEDGIEEAFELQTETSEAVRTGLLRPMSMAYLKQGSVSPACKDDGSRAMHMLVLGLDAFTGVSHSLGQKLPVCTCLVDTGRSIVRASPKHTAYTLQPVCAQATLCLAYASPEPDLACQAAVALILCMNRALCGASGLWIGDCFIYTNGAWRLNYCVGGEVTTMFHLDRPMYLLGYLAAQSKVYLIDKVSGFSSYWGGSTGALCLTVYQKSNPSGIAVIPTTGHSDTL